MNINEEIKNNEYEITKEYNREDIDKEIKNNGYKIIKKFINKKKIDKLMSNIRHNQLDDLPTIIDKKLIFENISKLSIGDSEGIGRPARFFRTIYINTENDIYESKEIFDNVIEFRNFLMKKDKNYLKNKTDNFWTGKRIQHYPIGGGFMGLHTDIISENCLEDKNDIFYQVLLNLTEHNIDYKTGGAYLIKNNEKIYLDNKVKPGDLLIYDGNTQHGVSPIDQNEKLDLSLNKGRCILFVTIYK